tara:strand:- start:1410 stop:2720 length:1311 start_codon:yes stop_codon:yes gene_type:complete
MATETPSAGEVPSTLAATSGGNQDISRVEAPDAGSLAEFDANFDLAEKETSSQPPSGDDSLPPDPVTPVEPVIPAVTKALESTQPLSTTTTTSPIPVEPVLDPEIAAIPKPKSLSPQNESNWAKVTRLADTYKKEAVRVPELEQQIKDLEARSPSVPEDITKELEELRHFRQVIDFENDPTFKSTYDGPIEEARTLAYDILVRNGMPAEKIEEIKKAGGPEKINGEWWQDHVISKLEFPDSKRFESSLIDLVGLQEKRGKEVGDRASKRDELIGEKETQRREAFTKDTEVIEQTLEEVTKDVPWARYIEVSPTATPEEKKKLEEHNTTVDLLKTSFEHSLYPPDAQTRARVAAAAAASVVLAKANQGLTAQLESITKTKDAEITKLLAENSALKSGGRVPKPTGIAPVGAVKLTDDARMKMSSEDAVEAGLAEVEG